MRALVQRVSRAAVTVAESTVGEIGSGLLVLLGITDTDSEVETKALVAKISKLRIFPDDKGVMNLSVKDTGGAVLVVSQFTLYADTRKGNRPSYIRAARPEKAQPLYQLFTEELRALGLQVATGEFGAMMEVSLINSGPVTIWLDSAELMK